MLAVRGKEIGYVPQDPQAALDPLFRVDDQVTEGLRLHRERSALLRYLRGDEGFRGCPVRSENPR